ncbi:MAG: YdcF family protein [Actinomycetota bacterium]|nr:YdcF family protein [Actinomycetota bacterium]
MTVAGRASRRGARSRRGLCVGVALALVAALAATTARLFIWPESGHAPRVDAVVVLSGDTGERMATARRLVEVGAAPVLVHAGTPDSQEVVRLCAGGGQAFEVVCLRPIPDSTRAEAQATARLAAARGWRSVTVVTSSPHVTRARLLFRRCFDAQVDVVAAWPPLSTRVWFGQLVHEWGGVIHALAFARSC